MADIICLSSDDECAPPAPKKRVILKTVANNNQSIDVDAPFKIVSQLEVSRVSSVVVRKGVLPDVVISDSKPSSLSNDDSNSSKCPIEPASSSSSTSKNTKRTNRQTGNKKKNKKKNGNHIKNGKRTSPTQQVAETPPAPVTNNDNNGKVESRILDFFRKCIHLVEVKNRDLVRSKVPYIKKLLRELGADIVENEMIEPIAKYENHLEQTPKKVLFWFTEMFEVLKNRYHNKSLEPPDDGEHSPEEIRRVRILKKTLVKLQRKISRLEQTEVNFDEEEDSAYLKLSVYKARAVLVHKTMCQALKRNTDCDRIIYKRLDYVGSQYQQINHTINKVYKDNAVFPTYHEFDKLVRRCVEKNHLDIPEPTLRVEIKMCFEKLGSLLQSRRKLDLYDMHNYYIINAHSLETSPELEQKLETHKKESQRKMEAIFQKYSLMQERGETQEVSPDTDDSNKSDSSSDVEIAI